MDLRLMLVSLFLGGIIEYSECLVCRMCYYAQDIKLCGATTMCPAGEHCGIHTFLSSSGLKRYHAGCISTEVCEGKLEAPINIVGRRRRRQANTVLIQCCDTDLCNVDPNNVPTGLPSASTTLANKTKTSVLTTRDITQPQIATTPSLISKVPTTAGSICIDHQDCQYLLQKFDICNDTNTAMQICPASCGHCMSSGGNVCTDISNDCRLLIDHFQVCRDREFSIDKCRKSCNLCGSTTTPKLSRETPPNKETPPNIMTIPNIETPPVRETPPHKEKTSVRETQPNIVTTPHIETPPVRETPPNRETPPTAIS